MPKIKINDIEMYYETQGQGEPIVLIAGFSADHVHWNEVVDHLKDSYQLITLDNRGAGQTDVPLGAYTIDQMAQDVVDLCMALGIKQANFVGNSMGGYIAQVLAYKHPKLVKSMVISNSTTATHTCFHFYVDAQLELIKANAPVVPLIRGSCSWAFSYQFLSQPGVFERLIQWGLQNPFPFTIAGYEGQYAALDQFDSSQWASNIKVPTLVISGGEDLIFSEKSVKALADLIPGAHYYCFEKCGHLPFIEYPKEFADLIKHFFK